MNEKTQLLDTQNGAEEVPIIRMTILALIIASTNLIGGIDLTFSSIALPEMDLSISDASWYASISSFGSLFGSALTGLLVDRTGRKPALLVGILPAAIGWFLQATSTNATVLLFGRFLCGIVSGAAYMGPVYIAECIVVNKPKLRGRFMSWNTTIITSGMCFAYVLGCFASYKVVAYVACIFALFSFLLVCILIPESPTWLHGRGRLGEAYSSERKLRVSQPILKTPSTTMFDVKEPIFSKEFILKHFNKLERKDIRRPLCLMATLMTLSMFTGGPCILSYMISTLSTSSDLKSSYYLGMVSGFLILIANSLVSLMLPHTGIKKHYMAACGSMAFGLVLLGFSSLSLSAENYSYMHMVYVLSIWLVTFTYSCGITAIPNTILGEMFPPDAKGVAAVPAIVGIVATGLIVKAHPYFLIYFAGYTYYGYAVFCVIALSFMGLCMPETVDKTVEQIGEYYRES